MPRMLRDIITQTVSHEPDMVLVGEHTERTDLVSAARASQADVVVVGVSDAELPAQCEALFMMSPGIRVLGITGDGRRAFLWELRPNRTPLGEVSPEGLVEAIRTAVNARSTSL
jgi:hypothetical protein